MPTINLDDLVNPSRLPRVTIFGREIVVKPLTGAAAHKVAAVAASGDAGEGMLGALLDVVRGSCPDLTAQEVDALTVDQIAALVQLSRNQITEVEAMLAERSEKN
jgi:hypothetical protein